MGEPLMHESVMDRPLADIFHGLPDTCFTTTDGQKALKKIPLSLWRGGKVDIVSYFDRTSPFDSNDLSDACKRELLLPLLLQHRSEPPLVWPPLLPSWPSAG